MSPSEDGSLLRELETGIQKYTPKLLSVPRERERRGRGASLRLLSLHHSSLSFQSL